MERDEELQQAADAYASQMCKDCSAKLYCEGKNKECIKRREREKVFADGAKWAEECPNLSLLWHFADKRPVGRYWRILCEDEGGGCWVASKRDAFTIGYNWQKFAEDKALKRWAYVSDLLPGGGE